MYTVQWENVHAFQELHMLMCCVVRRQTTHVSYVQYAQSVGVGVGVVRWGAGGCCVHCCVDIRKCVIFICTSGDCGTSPGGQVSCWGWLNIWWDDTQQAMSLAHKQLVPSTPTYTHCGCTSCMCDKGWHKGTTANL